MVSPNQKPQAIIYDPSSDEFEIIKRENLTNCDNFPVHLPWWGNKVDIYAYPENRSGFVATVRLNRLGAAKKWQRRLRHNYMVLHVKGLKPETASPALSSTPASIPVVKDVDHSSSTVSHGDQSGLPKAQHTAPPETPSFTSPTLQPAIGTDEERRHTLLRSIGKEGGTEQLVQSISQQLLLQHDANWGVLLGAMPQTLCFLGQCFLATASSVAASSLDLRPGSLLIEKTLRANLIHCSDLGRKAFTDAESKMNRVHLVTSHMCNPRGQIDEIVALLDDENLMKLGLQRQLHKLKNISQDCVRDSAHVKAQFARWQDYAIQVRRACTGTGDQIEKEKVKDKNEISIAMSQSMDQDDKGKIIEQQPANLPSRTTVHQEVSKNAIYDMPTGWNAIAQNTAIRLLTNWHDPIPLAIVSQPWALFGYSMQSSKQMERSRFTITLKGEPASRETKSIFGFIDKSNVNISREDYKAAQKALLEAENLLVEMAQRGADTEVKFNEVQLQLAKLIDENVNMREIISILKKCIDNLTKLLDHFDKLVVYFNCLSDFINVMNEGPAQELLSQVNNIMETDKEMAFETQKQRRARKEYLKVSLLVDALNLKGNYLVAGQLASVYVDISRKYIMPGVNSIQHLELQNGVDTSQTASIEKTKQILAYARKAQTEISSMAEQRRSELRDELYTKDREITEIGRIIKEAQFDNGAGSNCWNEWDEA